MHNLSTKEVVSSIEKTPLVELQGIIFQEYRDFFGKELLDILEDTNNVMKTHLENQTDLPRQRVEYSEPVMKKLKIFFMQESITTALEKKFDVDLQFSSVDLWYDSPGYLLGPHTDDHRIKLAIQIYLGDGDVGTCLYDGHDSVIKVFDFKNNNGYALLNSEVSRHGTSGIQKEGLRKSLYVRYQ